MNKKIYFKKGFSLVEIAMVLIIVGLISSATFSYTAQLASIKYKDSENKVKTIKKRLLIFVKNKGYLPCPEPISGNNGKEVFLSQDGRCKSFYAYVPYEDLGLTLASVTDSFGNRILYRVSHFLALENAKEMCEENGHFYLCRSTIVSAKDLFLQSYSSKSTGLVSFRSNYSSSSELAIKCKDCTTHSYLATSLLAAIIAVNNIDGLAQSSQGEHSTIKNEASKLNHVKFGTTDAIPKGTSGSDADKYKILYSYKNNTGSFDDYIMGISRNELNNALLKGF